MIDATRSVIQNINFRDFVAMRFDDTHHVHLRNRCFVFDCSLIKRKGFVEISFWLIAFVDLAASSEKGKLLLHQNYKHRSICCNRAD